MDSVVAPLPAILVAAQNPEEFLDMAAALGDEGCTMSAIDTDQPVLERLEKLRPALILLDAEARPDAFALCRELKSIAGIRDIPVLLILPASDAEGRAAAFAAGAADCLTRPLVREEALARIRTHVRLAAVQKRLDARNGELERLRNEHAAELNNSVELLRLKSCALNRVSEAAYLIDPDGHIRYANEEACRALGFGADELLGMRIPDIDPDWDLDAFKEGWQRLAQAGTAKFQSRHRRKDGNIFPVEIVASHFEYHGREYSLVLARDVSRRREVERKLGLLTSAIDRVHETIYLLDKESRIRYLNEEACRKLGYSAEELIGMPLEKIDPAVPPTTYSQYWQELVAAGRWRGESAHYRKDGSRFPIEVVSRLIEHGGESYCLCYVTDITDRKKTANELRLLDQAINQSTEAAFLMDALGGFVYVNDAACRSLGYSREELLAMSVFDIDALLKPDAIRTMFCQKLAGNWPNGAIETLHRRRDGSIFPVELSSSVVESDDARYLLSLVRDVTERKRAQRELLLLEQAVNHSQEAVFVMNTAGRFVYVNDAACKSLDYRRDELLRMGPSDIDADMSPEFLRQLLKEFFAHGPTRGLMESRQRRRDGSIFPVEMSASLFEHAGEKLCLILIRDVTERKAAQRQVALLNHAVNQAREAIYVIDYDFRIRFANAEACRAIGCSIEELTSMTVHDLDPDFTPEATSAMVEHRVEFGQIVMERRHRARDGRVFPVEILSTTFDFEGTPLVVALVRDITERKEAERRLRASEQAFRTLAENSPDVIVRYDREGRRLYVNPAVVKLWGRPADELLGTTPLDNAGIIDLQSYLGAMRTVLETGRTVSFEMEVRNAADEQGWFSATLVPELGADGCVDSALVIGHDITEIKRSELRFRTLAENLPENIIRHDRQGRMVYVNPRMLKTWGMTNAEGVLGKTLIEALGHEGSYRCHPMHMNVMETREPLTYDYTVPDAGDGNGERIHELHVVPECDEAGEVVGALVIGRDITERKLAEIRLHASEQAFRALVENSPDFIARYDGECRRLYLNPAATAMFGRPTEDVFGTTPFDASLLSDPRPYAETILQVVRTGQPATAEMRLRVGEELHWFDFRFVAESDSDGAIASVLVVGRDVTERKRAELELMLLNRAVDQSRDAFFLTGADQRLRYVNSAAVRSLGYERDELLSLDIPSIDPDLTREQLTEMMRQTAAFPGQSFAIERRHRTKNGQTFPVEIVATAFDYDGETVHLSVARDITERKRAEQERQEHLRFLETMDRVNDAIREAADMDRMMSAVLDIVLALFDCDRAFLIHPCDPDADAWTVSFERTRPEYPGAFAENATVPIDDVAADGMRRQLEADGPLAFGPGNEHPLPGNSERFGYRSLLSMALRPAIGHPWMFGLQQCSHERAWTPVDRRLLQEIGRRLADGLTGMLAHGILRDSELRYREIFENATDAIMIWDVTPEGRLKLLDVNPVWEKLTGADHRRMVGLCLDDVDRNPVAREALRQLRNCLIFAAPLAYEDTLKTPTGEWRLHTTLVPVADADGNIYRVVSIGRDITEQKRVEVRLRESYAMLQELAAHRDTAREEERTRIAREIHDELGQHLTALRMGISTVGFEFRDSQPLLVERVQRLTGLADQTIKVVRSVAAGLRPAVLDSGIAAALEWLVSEFQRHTGIACSVTVQASMPHIDAYRAVALFRIVQESLTNVARHAKAKSLSVSLREEEGAIILETSDDGCGFDLDAPRSRSFGLTGMRERALMLGGDISIESQPGEGTAVRLIIPLDSEKVPT